MRCRLSSWRPLGRRAALGLAAAGLCAALALPLPGARAQGPTEGAAGLVQATPPDGATLGTAPARIDMVFDKDLADESRIHLWDAHDVRVDRDDNQVDGKRMTIGVRDLAPGRYQVRWLATNDFDRTPARGGYWFQVGTPPTGQPRLAVRPDHGDAGQTFAIAGSGFRPNALVIVAIGDDQRGLDTPTTDDQGRFALQTPIPDYLPFGRQVVQALDLDGRMGTAAFAVARGGWPPLGVQMTLERPEAGGNLLHVEVRIANRSGWDLDGIVVSASVPERTRVLAEGLQGPEGTTNEVTRTAVHWRQGRARPHTVMDAFAYNLDVTRLPPGSPYPQPTVAVAFQHRAEPQFRGTAEAVALLPGQRPPSTGP